MTNDYTEFKAAILKLTGLDLSSYKEQQMKRRIESLSKRNNFATLVEYSVALKTNTDLFNEFINYLTINVSEFYRNPTQWDILVREILPPILEKNKNIKIWSAACSTGEEPYSLVMALSGLMPLQSIKIMATDIDKEVIAKAKIGLYSQKSVAGVPKDYVSKYFSKQGDFLKISDSVKRCVNFSYHNLLKDPYTTQCDLIVCRNVLIYFTEEAKHHIYKKFSDALKPEGILFVGSTEQIMGAANYNFNAIRTFFYQKELK